MQRYGIHLEPECPEGTLAGREDAEIGKELPGSGQILRIRPVHHHPVGKEGGASECGTDTDSFIQTTPPSVGVASRDRLEDHRQTTGEGSVRTGGASRIEMRGSEGFPLLGTADPGPVLPDEETLSLETTPRLHETSGSLVSRGVGRGRYHPPPIPDR